MGKPAARLGDMTAHGGSIVVGLPTVLIGGMPAARVGDMHVCPMLNPGVPPPPHVGGPIMMGSPMVLVGGMPAARMGDMVTCAGPPDTIMLGCMTVLIGEGGSGSASGGGAGMSAVAAAQASAATAKWSNLESTTKREHWVEFRFVDKAGLAMCRIPYSFSDSQGKATDGVLMSNGEIRRDALKSGQCSVQLSTVSNARWSSRDAEVGQKVKMSADVDGFPQGTVALFEVYRRDVVGPDFLVKSIEAKVKGNKIEAEWEYLLPGTSQADVGSVRGYTSPQYYFIVMVGSCKSRSGNLVYKDYIEIQLKDTKGKPIGGAEYKLHLADGQIRTGKLDQNGKKREEKIRPGSCQVAFPGVGRVIGET